MINIFDLQPNKVTKNLNVYPMVIMGDSGIGKTTTLNDILNDLADGDKKPLFVMLEDRYQHIPNIIPARIHDVPELEVLKGQLLSPKAKEMYSCIVFDTIDKLDTMLENYIAKSKEVEITGDLNFGKGNKYVKNKLFLIDELRNAGWAVHFTMQSYKNVNIMNQQVTYDHDINKKTWAKLKHDAYLVGIMEKDKKGNRYITFKNTPERHLLKDSIGMPDKVYASEFKDVLEKAILGIKGADFTEENTMITKTNDDIPFEDVVARGNELGGILANNGHLDEAMNILKTNVGQNDDGSAKMLDTLNSTQIDLAKVIVIKMEELINKYNLK